ncbi:MAG: hypothetical protein JWP95_237 [Actinotalea sp.]|nr:hypothetical protein [Actinotalea sp.]
MALSDWVIALAGSPWVFLALYAFATIDGFFPPIPSESVVIALAALGVATGDPNLWLVAAVAAAGAFTGDQIAYSIGRRIPVRRLRVMRGPRAQKAVDWAERALAERGAAFIISARYIPIGRVAVNMTAGTIGFSRRRFTLLAAIAAVTWATYSVVLGIGAGIWLGENPLLAVVVGVAGGMLIGVVVDAVLKRVTRGRRGRALTPEDVADAGAPGSPGAPRIPAEP